MLNPLCLNAEYVLPDRNNVLRFVDAPVGDPHAWQLMEGSAFNVVYSSLDESGSQVCGSIPFSSPSCGHALDDFIHQSPSRQWWWGRRRRGLSRSTDVAFTHPPSPLLLFSFINCTQVEIQVRRLLDHMLVNTDEFVLAGMVDGISSLNFYAFFGWKISREYTTMPPHPLPPRPAATAVDTVHPGVLGRVMETLVNGLSQNSRIYRSVSVETSFFFCFAGICTLFLLTPSPETPFPRCQCADQASL